jgi:hypothetical protein
MCFMSKENDPSRHTWNDDDDNETPRTFRNSYMGAMNQNRPGSRASDIPEDERRRPRNPSNRRRLYETDDEQPAQRPRPTRQSQAEVEARLRQRLRRNSEEIPDPPAIPTRRQPPLSGKQRAEYSDVPPRRARQVSPEATRRNADRDKEPFVEYDEIEIDPLQPESHHHRRKHRRGGRAASNVLIGCLGGLITLLVVAGIAAFLLLHNTPLGQTLGVGKSSYPQTSQQALTLGSATQLIVKNQLGNIVINVDQTASSATVTSAKKVQASSQSDANNLFKQMTLSVTPISQGSDPACLASTCLLITTAAPATTSNSGLLGGSTGNSFDLTVTLPASFNPLDPSTPPNTITADATIGNITVNGFNGILNLSGSDGNSNISVAHSLIYAGSCLQTTSGDITVDQGSYFNIATPSNLVPCRNTTSSAEHFWFSITGGKGNVSITFMATATDLSVDASLNSGKISDDFDPNIPTDSYQGPLDPTTNPTPTASLQLFTSTGNITLHKQ